MNTLYANKVAQELCKGDGYRWLLKIKHPDVDNQLDYYFQDEIELGRFLRVYEDMGWSEVERKKLNR